MTIRVVASGGTVLAAEISGKEDGFPVLLLHSLGCDGSTWAPQVAALAPAFKIVTPDARGHGESTAPGGEYTLERLGRDVLEVMDAAGIAAAHVCGISMGGLVALWLAINAPQRVRHLVLANTASRIGSTESWQEREAAVRTRGMEAVAEAVLGRFFGSAFREAHPRVVQRFRDWLLATKATGYAACCAALRDADLTADLHRIRNPVLVIGGAEDVSTPPEQARLLAAAIQDARLLILQAAHLSNVEQANSFSDALLAHLTAKETG